MYIHKCINTEINSKQTNIIYILIFSNKYLKHVFFSRFSKA